MINKTIWKCICQVQLKHTHTMFIVIIKVIFTGKEKLRTIIYCPHVYQLSLMSQKILVLAKPFKKQQQIWRVVMLIV